MAGHSHWAGIKRKKEAADKKRGAAFGKLLAAVTIAAREEQNPDFNPRLRTVIEKVRDAGAAKDKIESAIARASQKEGGLTEFLFGAYATGGIAILIEAISDNGNRTVSEIKKLLSDYGAKLAEERSVIWAFEKSSESGWEAKFSQEISREDRDALESLVDALLGREDVQRVTTNARP